MLTVMDYNVIIIGGGVGGTAIGAILASKGFKTLIIEKNDNIGGRCSTYEKKGFKIDVGAHVFSRTSNGPLGKILNMIEMQDSLKWVLAQKPGPRWHYQGKIWKFPAQFKELIPNSDFTNLIKLLRDVMRIKDTRELDNISVKSLLSKYTDNPLVHTFINIITMLYLVVPYYHASAGEFVRCFTSLSIDRSIGYPIGGCISIPHTYTNGIKKFGGDVKYGLSAENIIIKNERIEGVELENGEVVKSKIVISNAGIKETINNLIGRSSFDKKYLDYVDNLKYAYSAFTLKLALKRPVTSLKILTSFYLKNPEEKVNSLLGGNVPEEVDLFIPIPSNFDPSLTPKGNQLLIAGTAVPCKNFEKNKKKWVQNSMKCLENIFPGLSENLLWYDVSSPDDIGRLAGKESSVIGISQTTNQSGLNRPNVALPIEGLYMVGGDAGGWGIETELAAKSAIECSKLIYNKIKKPLNSSS